MSGEQQFRHSPFTLPSALHNPSSHRTGTARKAGQLLTDTMRRSFALWALALFFALQGWAQPLRVVTWRVDDFPEPPTNGPALEPDARRLRQVAAALKPLEADVILLHGLPDRNSAKRLTSFLKPGVYHVVNHYAFRRGGAGSPLAGAPLTILAKKQPINSRQLEWRSSGQIEAAGGFVWATFPHGTNTACLYTAHLPLPPASMNALTNALTEAQVQQHLRNREHAAQYLIHHSSWLGGTVTNAIASVLFAGDFIADPMLATGDATLRVLEQAGFHTAPSSTKRPARTQTADTAATMTIFARNADFAGTPLAGNNNKAFAFTPVTWDLVVRAPEVKPPEPKPAAILVAALTPSISTATGARRSWDPSHYIWLAVGLILITLVAVVIFQWLAWRRWTPAFTAAKHPSLAPAADAQASRPEALAAPRSALGALTAPAIEPAVLPAAAWPERDETHQAKDPRDTTATRPEIKPHLLGLLREKVVVWLNSQRTQLLHSQENGTAQVIELEERLEKIQGQFQDRLLAREQRISELETEVVAKDRMIHDLIRARSQPSAESRPDDVKAASSEAP